MKLNETLTAKSLDLTDKTAVAKFLKQRLEYYILNKKPADLAEDHSGDWFRLNDRNQVQWNWRMRTYPLYCVIEKEFSPKDAKKVQDMFDTYEDWTLVQSVLNSKDVKAFKNTFRDKDQMIKNYEEELERTNGEIARLRTRKEELKKLISLHMEKKND